MARWSKSIGSTIHTALFFDEPSNACWFGTTDGLIRSFRILGQTDRTISSGWTDAAAVLPSIDGLNLFVVVASGRVLVVSRTEAERDQAALAASIDAAVLSATRLQNDDILILDDAGQVHRVTPGTGTVDLVTTVQGATGLAADEVAGELLVVATDATSQIHRFRLDDGSIAGEVVTITAPVLALSASPAGHGVVTCDNAGNLSLQNWAGAIHAFTFHAPGTTSLCRWHSLIIAAAGESIELVEWSEDVETLRITAAPDPLVPGGWAPMFVDYAGAGMTQDDVEWTVDEGPGAATLSIAQSVVESGAHQEHRVIAGLGTPEFHITARHRSAGIVVATRRFRVAGIWPDTEIGPPVAITGPQRVHAQAGWGGGGGGPQNVKSHPAPEEFVIAVAMFRTKGATSVVDAGQRLKDVKEFVLGTEQPSVKRYYEEVSLWVTPKSGNPADPKGTSLTLLNNEVFGPIDLPYSWADLFEHPDPKNVWREWDPKGGTWDILSRAFYAFLANRGLGSPFIAAKSLVFAMLPGTDAPLTVGNFTWPAQWCWAYASVGAWVPNFFKSTVLMPAAFPASHPSPWANERFVTMMCHELGHTLGCADQYPMPEYPGEIANRYIMGWDVMEDDSPLPYFSLPHRMRLGWINPDWIEVCDFSSNTSTREVTLQPIEALTRSGPPPGQRAGVEIRIRDSWNYYFEYRRRQTARVGDRKLFRKVGDDFQPVADAILGTDVNQTAANKLSRPLILLLPMDADKDGPILESFGKAYTESDATNPDRMYDFNLIRLTHVPSGSESINVRIQYVEARRPDLQIAPAPGNNIFKSPDITLDGPLGIDIAVKGMMNTIKVRVHNRGTKDADSVQIRVQWLPFTTAPGPWNQLPNPPAQPIMANSTREYTVRWPLPASVKMGGIEAEHFCVRADVDRYIDPTDPAGSEVTVDNNWAQSNFSSVSVGHSSPSERMSTAVTATNILPVRAIHNMVIEQTSEHFRTFADHAWRRLGPRQTDVTRVSFESLAGDPLHDASFQAAFRQIQEKPLENDLTARTFVFPEGQRSCGIERWGVQLLVRAGLRTFVENLSAAGELVAGTIRGGEDSKPRTVNEGNVRLVGWPLRRPDEEASADGQVDALGRFHLLLPSSLLWVASREPVMVMVFYQGSPRFTPCHSMELILSS